jgi:hypothetical protein
VLIVDPIYEDSLIESIYTVCEKTSVAGRLAIHQDPRLLNRLKALAERKWDAEEILKGLKSKKRRENMQYYAMQSRECESLWVIVLSRLNRHYTEKYGQCSECESPLYLADNGAICCSQKLQESTWMPLRMSMTCSSDVPWHTMSPS